jgi:hypothetical protein
VRRREEREMAAGFQFGTAASLLLLEHDPDCGKRDGRQ